MDKNESALVIIKIVTKLVSPYIVLSQEYYSRIFDPRKEVVAPIIKKKKKLYHMLCLTSSPSTNVGHPAVLACGERTSTGSA